MIIVSLLVNILVLIPVCAGLLRNKAWAVECYGSATPARGILLSIYFAIGALSLFFLLFNHSALQVATLLVIQIIYKITTPFTVGNLSNPVVISNLLIAALHTVTLWLII